MVSLSVKFTFSALKVLSNMNLRIKQPKGHFAHLNTFVKAKKLTGLRMQLAKQMFTEEMLWKNNPRNLVLLQTLLMERGNQSMILPLQKTS